MKKLLSIIAFKRYYKLVGAITFLLAITPLGTRAQGFPAPTACPQFFSSTGQPLAGGLLRTFISGTLTPQNTYTDATLTTPNSNPIVLNAGGFAVAPSGSCGIWLDPNLTYTFTLQNSFGVQQWSVDNISGSNFTQFLTQPHTWTSLQTFSGGAVIPNLAASTFTGQKIENVRFADQYPSLQAAISDCNACEVYVSVGTNTAQAPITTISITHPVWIHGAGIQQTIIQPTAALASSLFTIAGAGVKFSDLTIDMTNAPAQTALAFSSTVKPVMENVQILYPSTTGTGTAVSMTANAEMHARNILIKGAGICFDVQGDASAENFYDDIVCEDPGSFGYRRQQTTSTDVGGEYLTHFKVTNPDNRTTAGAFLVTSSVANTGSPFFCLQCVGDNMKGTHTYRIHNMVNVFLDTPWATNSSAQVNSFSGINIDNSTNVFIKGGYLASLYSDLVLSGTDTTITLRDNFYAGTATNIIAAGSTLAGIYLRDPIFSASSPMTAADRSLIGTAAGTFQSANAFRVDVSGSGTGVQSLQLHDTDIADSTPNAYLRTGANSGTFQVLNNAFAQIFAVNQTGTVATLGTNRVLFHGYQNSCVMVSATSCTFTIPATFSGTPLTYVSLDATSAPPATAISARCAVSGTTVTITAGTSNALTWDCLVVGNPD